MGKVTLVCRDTCRYTHLRGERHLLAYRQTRWAGLSRFSEGMGDPLHFSLSHAGSVSLEEVCPQRMHAVYNSFFRLPPGRPRPSLFLSVCK